MFERRPLFGALLGLTLIVTVWHMSFQETGTSGTTSSASSSSGSSYQESANLVPPYMHAPSTAHHFLPALQPPSSDDGSMVAGGGANEVEGIGPVGGSSIVNQSAFPLLLSSILVNPLEMLPKDDYNNLIDLKDFKFIINFNNCSAESGGRSHPESVGTDSLKIGDERRSPLVLVLVHSAPTNWYKRNTIRDTWGQYDPRAKLVFLIGAVNSSVLQRRLEKENHLYDDIVQGNFIDAYRNMTYKHVMALKWFTYHCPEAKYVLKVDDDVFVNTPVLYDVLESASQRRRLLFCQEIVNAPVKRTHRSKWYVSVPEYRNKYYPNHCPGYSIIYTPDVAFELYREAQQQPYFWIDDVHLTGTIARRINVTITPTGKMLLNQDQKDAILDKRPNATDQLFFFTTPDLREDEIRRLWKAVTYPRNGR